MPASAPTGRRLTPSLSSYAVQGAKRFSPIRSGDALIVWKLHRPASSMKQLFENYRDSSGEGN